MFESRDTRLGTTVNGYCPSPAQPTTVRKLDLTPTKWPRYASFDGRTTTCFTLPPMEGFGKSAGRDIYPANDYS